MPPASLMAWSARFRSPPVLNCRPPALRWNAGTRDWPSGIWMSIGTPDAKVTIGATRYTPFGESTYLQSGNESIVLVYDSASLDPDDVVATLAPGTPTLADASVLTQTVG